MSGMKDLIAKAKAQQEEVQQGYTSYVEGHYIYRRVLLIVLGYKTIEADAQWHGFKNSPYVRLDLDKDHVSFYKDKTHASPMPDTGGNFFKLEKVGDKAMVAEIMHNIINKHYGDAFKEIEKGIKALENVYV